jgi:predicted metal-dependent phosphoesterase TrpH
MGAFVAGGWHNGTRTVLKIELHAHTGLDPSDLIPHTTRQLIDRAADLGYGALAVTLHDRYFDITDDQMYACARHVVLIRGIERTIEGCHLLLLNFPPACASVSTFDDVRALRRQHPGGLVIAPHAFYPIRSALGSRVERCADLIDAVEVSSMFTSWLDFNRRAVDWAARHGKPLVGTTDLHLLAQLGTTYTLVDAAPDADAICAAIRAGRVEVRSTPLPGFRAAALFGISVVLGLAGRARRIWRR